MRQVVVTVIVGFACACGSVSTKTPDAMQCVPQTDTELCAAATACESHSGMDNCGTMRTVDCGACAGGMGCVMGTCRTPVCTTFTYTSTPIPTFSQSGIEDSIGAATPDGQTVVYIPSPSSCGSYHLVVADEVTPGSGTYTKRDVTTAFAGLGIYTGQDGHTITADGLTIIARSTDSKRLVSTKRTAINMTDFGPASTADFDAINAQVSGNAGIMFGPAISADGLQLFYSVSNIDAATNGVYTSIRNNTMMPFPAGVRATSPVQDYALVSGISSDRLALFMFDSGSFSTKVLTRTSTSQPFTNPNAPGPPPMISSGWQHKPLMDCSKLLAMVSPGGCGNEDIALFTRQ